MASGFDSSSHSSGPGMGGRFSLRSLKTFTSFKNPIYRIYYAGLIFNMAPQNMQMMARSLLIYRLTGSASILGLMSLANALPMLFLSLYGGVVADRVQKKFVIIAGQAASAVVSLGVALALSLGYLSADVEGSWWILMVSSLLQGTAWGLMMPSRQAIVREIVSEEDLMNALSLSTMGMNALRLLAPALTGFLIEFFDFSAVYFTMTGLYGLACVFIAFLPRTSTITIRGGGAVSAVKEGFKYILRETHLLYVLMFTLLAVILSMPYMMLLPIFTEDILKVGASGMGLLMSISGVGAIVGSLVLASLPNKKRGLMLLASCLFMGVALTAFSFSNTWSLSLLFIIFVGLGQTGRMTLANTLLQYYSDDEYRGRVMSIYMMEFGLTSFGTFAAGIMADSIGVQWAVGGFAMTLIVVATFGLIFLKKLRRLD